MATKKEVPEKETPSKEESKAVYEVRNLTGRPIDLLRVDSKKGAISLFPKQAVSLAEDEISRHMKDLCTQGVLSITKK